MNSVIEQTLNRNNYEIIVTKNFIDSDIENYLIENNIKVLFSGNVDQGKQLYDAINLAQGEVIALLDDDDLFEKNKLESILSHFHSNPNLIYVHNQYKTLRDGVISDKTIYHAIRNDIYIENGKLNVVKKYLKNGIWSNNSSICFRKIFLANYIDILKSIKSRIDFFIFYTALMSHKDILLMSTKFTIYRIHNSETHSVDLATIKDQRKLFLTRYSYTNELLFKVCEDKEISKLIQMDQVIIAMNLRLVGIKDNIKLNQLHMTLVYAFIYRKIYPLIILFFFTLSLLSERYLTSILTRTISVYYTHFY